ncbi:alpha/beta fold hydrolase [Brevundimonas sp. VNH65]|uniref:alpha/beta fold hydrolase n=1 Tax=Brevundimonas sp. VNH65 TaxID=3400917 RepID=UPI003C08B71B
MSPVRPVHFLGLIAGLSLAACATPHVQPPMTPSAGFTGPEVVEQTRPGAPGVLVMADGARLPFLRWTPQGRAPEAVIVALHGMNDHDASFRLAGPWWAAHGVETWAYDQRGFGRAPGRGEWAGTERMVQDLRETAALIRARRPGVPIVVVGESMGGSVAAAAFASETPPDADRVVLLAPGVWGWSSQNLFNRTSLWVAAHALGDVSVEPPEFVVRHILASDNIVELVRNGRDPDSILSTRFDTLYGLVSLMQTASESLGRLNRPTLLMYGAHDQVVEKGPMRRALAKAGDPPDLTTAWYPEGRHLLNRDLGAEVVYRDVLSFVLDPSAPLPSGAGSVGPHLGLRSPEASRTSR